MKKCSSCGRVKKKHKPQPFGEHCILNYQCLPQLDGHDDSSSSEDEPLAKRSRRSSNKLRKTAQREARVFVTSPSPVQPEEEPVPSTSHQTFQRSKKGQSTGGRKVSWIYLDSKSFRRFLNEDNRTRIEYFTLRYHNATNFRPQWARLARDSRARARNTYHNWSHFHNILHVTPLPPNFIPASLCE